MFDEEALPQKTTDAPPQPRSLDTLSIEELKDYISWMHAEIARVEHVITQKQAAGQAAEHFFK